MDDAQEIFRDVPVAVTLRAGDSPLRYCLRDGQRELSLASAFFPPQNFLQKTIIEVDANGGEMPSYSVTPLGEDDFYRLVENGVFGVVGLFSPSMQESYLKERKSKKASFGLREMLSACPTAFDFDLSQSVCSMQFSPMGESCITIAPPPRGNKPLQLTVRAFHNFDFRKLIFLAAGFGLSYIAYECSKSKIFQYTGGMAITIALGLGIIIWFLDARFGSRFGKSVFLVITVTGGYVTSLMYFIRNSLSYVVLNYWEYLLGYFALMALIGCFMTMSLRSSKPAKMILRYSIDWVLNMVAALLFFHASPSPLVALCIVGMFFAYNLIHGFSKYVLKSEARTRRTRRPPRVEDEDEYEEYEEEKEN